jgi:hypothetical protein
MKTSFTVYKGEINLSDNRIIITDGIFRRHKFVNMVFVAIYIAGGLYILGRYFVIQNIKVIPLGISVLAIGIVGLITGLKVSTDKSLDIRQVERAVIREDFASNLNLTLYLKNSQKRMVVLDYRDEDHFRKFYLKELTETLSSFEIPVELK